LPRVKIIGRGGVGMDIDVDYAKSKGIHVIIPCFIIRISCRISFFAHLPGVRFYMIPTEICL
jgi:hypothetical protein